MTRIAALAKSFRDDERGSLSVEFVLVVPILVWVFLSTFVYFDVFRVETNSVRATITIAEMFSREELVSDIFVDNAKNVLQELTFEEADPDVRITVYRYEPSDTSFRVIWSEDRGFGATVDDPNAEQPLTDADLQVLQDRNRLPLMDAFDQNIFIETRTDYDAPFNIGLGPFVVTNLEDLTFTSDMIIRPRIGRLCWDPDTDVANDENCGPGSLASP